MAALIGVSTKPAASGGGYSCKVPLDLVSADGVPPEQGDKVSYSVDGTVESVDAETATISITAIDGQPVTDESAAEESTEGPGDQPSAAMRPKLAAGAASAPPGGGSLGMF